MMLATNKIKPMREKAESSGDTTDGENVEIRVRGQRTSDWPGARSFLSDPAERSFGQQDQDHDESDCSEGIHGGMSPR